MPSMVKAIAGEYTRYKALAEGAFMQLSEGQLAAPTPGHGNSVATICWHVAGNLKARFTDFLTSDGEKPWRQREQEFAARTVTHAELLAQWEAGWSALTTAIDGLDDGMLDRTVAIRQQPLTVGQALTRSLSHVSYHVGQIVFAARMLKGDEWRFLSIPPGQTDAYNAHPGSESPEAHAQKVKGA